jgi:lysozyme
MTQRLSAKGAAFVRHHEGFVANWYLDPVGIPTIGVGFTWLSDSFREWWGKNKPGQAFAKGATMTRAEADDALQFMCAKEYGAAVARFLGRPKKQHVFDGTTSPVYNLGTGSLKWTWAAAVKRGDLKDAANRLRVTGTTARGKKLRGLVIRREAEARLLEHGDYGTGGAVAAPTTPDDPMADGVLVRGERGAAVTALQKALAAKGHYAGNIDDVFGFGTEAAVMAFQRANGLKADGFAGPKTLERLAVHGDAPPTTPSPAPTNWLAALISIVLSFLKGRK